MPSSAPPTAQWLLAETDDGGAVLACDTGGSLRYLEAPSTPEQEALERLGDRLDDLRILVIPPCSTRTINAIMGKASNLRRLVIADNSATRLEAWRGVQQSLGGLPVDILPLSDQSEELAGTDLETHLLRYWDEFLLGKTSVYMPSRFKRAAPDLAAIIERKTLRLQQSACSDVVIRQLRGWRIHVNTILNTPRLPHSYSIDLSRRADLVVVVGAGPSLDESAPELARLQDKALIVATDGSLNTLLANGVRPDLVASMDDTVRTWRYVASNLDKLSTIPLVTTLRANHVLLDGYPGPVVFVKDERPSGWASPLVDRLASIATGRCVGHMAYHLAEALQPRAIIMVGFDLGFRDGRFHPSAMPNPYYHDHQPPNIVEVESSAGGRIKTELSMCFYLRYFEEAIRRSAAEVINATEGGALLRGARLARLRDALAGGTGTKTPPLRPAKISPQDSAEVLERLTSRLATARQDIIDHLHRLATGAPSAADYSLAWLSQEEDVYRLLAESGNYLQLAQYRELCRTTPSSSLDTLVPTYHSTLDGLLEASDLLLEAARARGSAHDQGTCLAFTPREVSTEKLNLPTDIRIREIVDLPASTTLPAILKTIRERKAGTLLAINGAIIPDAWSIPGIWCVDVKTTFEPREYERSLWIPHYTSVCAVPSIIDQWSGFIPPDIETMRRHPATQ